jgi:hypothetical protein
MNLKTKRYHKRIQSLNQFITEIRQSLNQFNVHTLTSQYVKISVADPDPYVVRPPESGSVNQMYRSGSFYHEAKKSKKNLYFYYFVTSMTFNL